MEGTAPPDSHRQRYPTRGVTAASGDQLPDIRLGTVERYADRLGPSVCDLLRGSDPSLNRDFVRLGDYRFASMASRGTVRRPTRPGWYPDPHDASNPRWWDGSSWGAPWRDKQNGISANQGSRTVAPGWYPDPDQKEDLRWWDGSDWEPLFASLDETGVISRVFDKYLGIAAVQRTQYLGGLTGFRPMSLQTKGILVFGPDCIELRRTLKRTTMIVIEWRDVRGVSFETGTVEKSRLGRALLVGWWALTMKATQRDTHLSLFLKDGSIGVFRVEGMSAPAVRAQLQPYLSLLGIQCLDDAAPADPAISKADELTKLAQLRDSGVLTDAEFAAEKGRLLGT